MEQPPISQKAKLHLGFDLNLGVPRKLFLTEGNGAERPFVSRIIDPARIVFYLIQTGKPYVETVFTDQEQLHEQRLQRILKKQANISGFQLIPAGT